MIVLGVYFIYLFIGIFIFVGIVLWGIGELIKLFMVFMNEFLVFMVGVFKVVLGVIFGGMMVFDMGGLINKVVMLFV